MSELKAEASRRTLSTTYVTSCPTPLPFVTGIRQLREPIKTSVHSDALTHPFPMLTRCGWRTGKDGRAHREHPARLARGQLQSSGSYTGPKTSRLQWGCGHGKAGLFGRVKRSTLGLLAAPLRIGRGTNGPRTNG